MIYKKTILNKQIDITHIYTIHYFEYSKDFYFKGESHDFWEFLYVDKGKVIVHTDETIHHLKAGQMIFHKPNEFHNVVADGIISPNLIVVSFDCKSEEMSFFNNRQVTINNNAKNLLVEIIKEFRCSFHSELNNYKLEKLIPLETQGFAGEQLINMYLEQLLINLIRDNFRSSGIKSSIHEKRVKDKLSITKNYMSKNLNKTLTINLIAKETGLSVSSIQKTFKSEMNMTPLKYFRNLKFDEAKLLIRNGNMNFTQISERLGFSSLHYFSRSFRTCTGMSLSEYAVSVKVKIS